ncbi:hypothetical protein GGS20DRAFT_538096 [Poronia punctata]|nr:hypothetical protein GGS20DRAFT_538096 [Poronia punctata]
MKAKRLLDTNASVEEIDEQAGPEKLQPHKKKRRLARLEEYEEDVGRARSRDFQKWAKVFENFGEVEAKRSAAFLNNFRADVKKREAEFKTYRHNEEKQFVEGANKLAVIFKEVFDDKDRQSRPVRQEEHILYKQMRSITADYQSLMKQYNSVEEQLSANKLQLPEVNFEQDRLDFKELLVRSVSHGVALVERILAPKLRPSTIFEQPTTNKLDEVAKKLFDGSQEVFGGETWGHIAETQVKYFTAMAATALQE